MMVRDKYAVRLAQEQREELQHLIRVGKNSARVTARARILLKSDDGWAAPQVAEALDVALSSVYRVKQRFAEEGLERVLQDRPQANRPRKLDDRGEAHLIALACSPAPEGHDHWTLRLLAGKVVELGLASSMSHEGVRKRLKKTLSSLSLLYDNVRVKCLGKMSVYEGRDIEPTRTGKTPGAQQRVGRDPAPDGPGRDSRCGRIRIPQGGSRNLFLARSSWRVGERWR